MKAFGTPMIYVKLQLNVMSTKRERGFQLLQFGTQDLSNAKVWRAWVLEERKQWKYSSDTRSGLLTAKAVDIDIGIKMNIIMTMSHGSVVADSA